MIPATNTLNITRVRFFDISFICSNFFSIRVEKEISLLNREKKIFPHKTSPLITFFVF